MIGVIKRRRLRKPAEAVNEMENGTPQIQRPKTHPNKEGLQVQIPNNDQETIATEMTRTTTTASTDTKPETGGTSKVVYCTRDNKAKRPIATSFHCLEEGLACEMNFTYHDLQHKTHQTMMMILSTEIRNPCYFPRLKLKE